MKKIITGTEAFFYFEGIEELKNALTLLNAFEQTNNVCVSDNDGFAYMANQLKDITVTINVKAQFKPLSLPEQTDK